MLQRTAAINNDGIGLGLTIVKQLVECAGGQIVAESRGIDQGSTFTFNLPLKMHREADEPNVSIQNSPERSHEQQSPTTAGVDHESGQVEDIGNIF